ncbi:MAG TPA: alpha/beta fold hydrolase [Planctomycetota bacterium]|nr:alpha/beta fold hydrolase [Planctomycetota bacterium]
MRAPVLRSAAALVALVAGRAAAEEPPEPKSTGPTAVSLETADGRKLAADLYEPAGGGESKGAVLALHAEGGTRDSWRALGKRLSACGISLLAPDLRGHGESRGTGDADLGPRADARDPALWKEMAADVQAGLKHLRGTLLADAKRIGIVGAGAGAGLALEAAEKDAKVRAVFGVAPSPAACGLAGLASAVRWDGRPVGFVVGSADEKGDAATLAKEIRKHPRAECIVLPREEKAPAAVLLAEPRAVDETAQFFHGWFERPVLTGKPEEGVRRGGGIFASGSSTGYGTEAGGMKIEGYHAPGRISAVILLVDPDPSATRLTESSRKITLTPGTAGKSPALSAVVESWTGKAWKAAKPITLVDCGAFVSEGKTTFYQAWLSPGLLGVPPFGKVALALAPVVDGKVEWPDARDPFGGSGGKGKSFSTTNPSTWNEWELR